MGAQFIFGLTMGNFSDILRIDSFLVAVPVNDRKHLTRQAN